MGQRSGMSADRTGYPCPECRRIVGVTEPQPSRKVFWTLVVGAIALEAAAAVSFAAAVFSDPLPRRVYDYSGSQGEIFGRATSLGWSSDRGFLIAAIALFVLGVVALVVAVRQQ
jgi:hypothetical protein